MVKLLYESIVKKYMMVDKNQITGEELEIPESAEKASAMQDGVQDKGAGMVDLSTVQINLSKRMNDH